MPKGPPNYKSVLWRDPIGKVPAFIPKEEPTFVPKEEVAELKSGDHVIYKSGARRLLTEVKLEGDTYHSKIDRFGSCCQISYKVVNGRVMLPKDAIGIDRE